MIKNNNNYILIVILVLLIIFAFIYLVYRNYQYTQVLESFTNNSQGSLSTYYTNNIDLFINGKLDTSIKRNVNDDNFKINDLIYIGQERGLAGGICNFVYNDAPLLGEDIKYNYNYNKYNKPPV